jgi:hypothetical protein
MTEFKLYEGNILGLMPEKGIKKLLGNKIPDSFAASGVPRAEHYFRVKDPVAVFAIAVKLGATE